MLAILTESSRIRMGFTRRLFTCKRRSLITDLKFLISRNQRGIEIAISRKSFGSAASIEFLVDCDAKYLSIRFSHIDAPYERCWCNLEATLENLVKFVDEFPNNNEQLSRIIMEIEKEQKLKEIAQNTIRATISHIMNSTKHRWKLFETENSFSLEVTFDKGYTIQMSFDIQNYLDRIPALQNVLKQTEIFLKEIPFPISIKALDKSRF